MTDLQYEIFCEYKRENDLVLRKVPYDLSKGGFLKSLCTKEPNEVDWSKGDWEVTESSSLKKYIEKLGLTDKRIIEECRELDEFLTETPEIRIARGDEPIPGGLHASKKKRNLVREDDYLNGVVDKDRYLLRVYPPTNKKDDVDAFVKEYDEFLTNHLFKKVKNISNDAYYYEKQNADDYFIDKFNAAMEEKSLHFDVKKYDNKWTRGHLYRTRFYRYNGYRDVHYCAYCGKKVAISGRGDVFGLQEKGEVDHLIPVSKLMNDEKMSDGTSYRDLAEILGIKRADSPLNLVASCHRCNERKRTSTKDYLKHTFNFGRHYWYWKLRHSLLFAGLMVIIGIIWYFWQFN